MIIREEYDSVIAKRLAGGYSLNDVMTIASYYLCRRMIS
jgi:hypothetical protein